MLADIVDRVLREGARRNGDPGPRLQGRVELTEALGSEVLVHVAAGVTSSSLRGLR